ncbi:hypothetical protein DF223_14970 [Mycetocola zhujimingii]|uniref:Uncharacterized protein n=1 Tax=Mycetocola zhujimingii TaxID=2079792 RepID=A0A2U1TAL4_9MICO|nr:hypothetical protein DF223_14970 [Mycetocola zhujimingii]
MAAQRAGRVRYDHLWPSSREGGADARLAHPDGKRPRVGREPHPGHDAEPVAVELDGTGFLE